MVPLTFRIVEAWSNAVMSQLFDQLLEKQEITHNKLESNIPKRASSSSSQRKKERMKRKQRRRRRRRRTNCFTAILDRICNLFERCCCCCKKGTKKSNISNIKQNRAESKRLTSKSESESLKSSSKENEVGARIEEYEFANRGFKANWSKFWSFMKSGSDQNTNIVAQMSSVSVFAFIDKQGICTENQKYVDELAVLDVNQNRVIIDLTHDENIPEEEVQVYNYEGAKVEFTDKQKKPTVLSLAIMLSRNPKEDDEAEKLKEVFMNPDTEVETFEVNQKPGFHFHNSAWSENEYHQDCGCALSIMFG